uniref:NADH dehydrogenase subunit 6 n=1 Tax=Biomphalaria choanomphala TaxID=158987 RepID=A0A2U8J9H0_BIOCH|nr:NADH dehydrogenase subunit 6 [Biomphalaria choanomphala]AWK49482.1 NADH dehydrogenase subunit 6 [Biomphalaria choanomphala]
MNSSFLFLNIYSLFMLVSVFLMVSFISSSPVSLGISLFFTSVFVVMLMSIFFNMWYSYILFLVYIGGLLVLFIYMCMMSTNEKFHFKLVILYFLPVFFCLQKFDMIESKFMGYSCYESSYYMSMSMFLGLVVVLFITLLSILRILSVKKILYV